MFGNRRFVRGFLLNNQLTDFAFRPEEDGALVANRVEGGKRPRSSMSPTMVFDADGRLVLVAGSPGGHAIINYVARVVVAVLDWEMGLQDALDAPHFGSRNGPTELESGTSAERLRAAARRPRPRPARARDGERRARHPARRRAVDRRRRPAARGDRAGRVRSPSLQAASESRNRASLR